MPTCPVCEARKTMKRELLIVHGAMRHIFDIDRAKQIVKDKRVAYPVPRLLLLRLLDVNGGWSIPHLEHLQMDRPGICANLMGGTVLLDGLHRGARSANQGLVFHAQLLTFSEMQSCLVIEGHQRENHTTLLTDEIQQILEINPEGDIVAELEAKTASREAMETQMRACLSAKDNARVRLVFHDKF